MILETLKSTNEALKHSIDAERNNQSNKRFNHNIRQLCEQLDSLELLILFLEMLHKRGFASKGVITDSFKTTLAEAIDDSGQKVSNYSFDDSSLKRFKLVVESCRSNCYDLWNEVADNESASVVQALNSLASLLSDKATAENVTRKLKEARLRLPLSDGALDAFIANIKKGQDIINKLDFNSKPSIKLFIDKVRAGNATLKDLNPEVLQWLEDHKLMFKIKLGF